MGHCAVSTCSKRSSSDSTGMLVVKMFWNTVHVEPATLEEIAWRRILVFPLYAVSPKTKLKIFSAFRSRYLMLVFRLVSERPRYRKGLWVAPGCNICWWVEYDAISALRARQNFSRWHFDFFFLIFTLKIDFDFHAKFLLRRQFAWKVKAYFLKKKEKKKKIILSMCRLLN